MILPEGYAHITMFGGGTGMPQGWAWTLGLDIEDYSGTPQQLANGIRDDLVSSTLMTNFQSTVVHQGVLVKFGPTSTGPSATNTAPVAGTAAGNQAPPNQATLVHKSTAFGGRAGRGRMYLPPVNEGSITPDGLIDSALVNAIQTDLASFFAALDTRLVHPVLLHGAGSPLSTPSLITDVRVDGRIATQRRRLRR